jgi:hypothetical protein
LGKWWKEARREWGKERGREGGRDWECSWLIHDTKGPGSCCTPTFPAQAISPWYPLSLQPQDPRLPFSLQCGWSDILIPDRDAQCKDWRFGTKEISRRGSVIQSPSLFHQSYEPCLYFYFKYYSPKH